MKYIKSGIDSGATLVTGGLSTDGRFVQPTIFTDVTQDMAIARDEIFGPVMCVLKFKDAQEV